MAGNKDLATAIKKAKTSRMMFAFVSKGSEGSLLVERKVPPKDIAEAKKELGGGTVFKGRCYGEDGQMIFEVAKEPPSTLAGLLKRFIMKEAGLSLNVEVRVALDAEDETESVEGQETTSETGEVPEAPPTPSNDEGAKTFTTRLKALMPLVLKITQAKLQGSETLTNLVTQANTQAKGSEFTQANATLDKVEQLVKAFAKNLTPSSPPATNQVAVIKRLTVLTPDYKAALAKKGPETATLQTLFDGLKGLLDAKNFDQAATVLDKLEPLVARALTAQPTPTAPQPSNAQAEVTKRLNALTGDIKTALAEKRPEAPRIQTLMASIKDSIAKKEFDSAGKVLDELETLLSKPETQPQQEKPTAPPVGGRVQFTRARLRWDSTRKTVQAELKKLEEAILKASANEPNADEIAAGATGLYDMLEVLDTRLIDKLDEALNAEQPDAREKLNKEAGVIVKEYLTFVNSDPLVQAVDDNPFMPVAVRSTLVDTLNTLATQLA